MRKLKTYQPTRFMADGSHYNEELAELAVAFIGCLKHTKGEWYGQNFELIDWQEPDHPRPVRHCKAQRIPPV